MTGGVKSLDSGRISAPFLGLFARFWYLGLSCLRAGSVGVQPSVAPGISGIKFRFRACLNLSLDSGGRVSCPGELEMFLHILPYAQGVGINWD